MSGTLQTLTASYHVVSIIYDLSCLVKKVVHARPEAQKWLDQCNDFKTIAIGVRHELRSRVKERREGQDPTKHEEAIEKVLQRSVRRCRRCLLAMTEQLRPLNDVPDDRLIKSIPERVKFVFETDFINSQQNLLDRQIRNISLAFHLLDSSDRRADRAERRVDSARTQRMEQAFILLEQRLTQHLERSRADAAVVGDEAPEVNDPTHQNEAPSAGPPPAEPALPEHASSDEDDIGSNLSFDGDSDSDLDRPESRNVSRESVMQVVRNPLLEAIKLKNVNSAKTLLAEMEDNELQIYDEDNWTLLHHAVLVHSDMMAALLQRSPTKVAGYLNGKNDSEQTPLMDASWKADSRQGYELVQLLLQQPGIEVNAKDGIGRTALHICLTRPPGGYNDKVVDMLLEYGADVKLLIDSSVDDRIKCYPAVQRLVEQIQKQGKKDRRSSIIRKLSKTSRT